ncbi:S8 family serine peptidase [Catenuloplanes japonicus]|uniref:S8 family serine peptidase n=1 Tax=Catenuloplanes japonicus TaxID=33876 RepID=UPI00068ED940|nr:S8 family serine peptidase [Catenuloplanes japonicus]
MTPPAADHRTRWIVLRWLTALLLVAAPLLPARAEAAAPAEFWKYYVVATGPDGQPEDLRDIAARLLGSGDRNRELIALNSGRRQPDGGTLTGADALRTGWILALPWDAAGPEVRYGVLPDDPAAVSPAPPATGASCPARGPDRAAPGGLPWAQLTFNLTAAWVRGRGAGLTVAVVDTGVDRAAPALGDRVLDGTAVDGSTATVDCTGHGTAMAGIIAAQAARADEFSGVAPASQILPIRVPAGPGARALADALRLAVDGGASVIALTAGGDLAAPEVTAAIDHAVRLDVAVVVPAGGPDPGDRPGLLRVGGVGADRTPVQPLPSGNADVVAPGVGVTTLGTAGRPLLQGDGADFAAAFAAGLLALVRASAPDLPATDAAQLIEATAQRDGAGTPDPGSGWGFIDPATAVDAAVAARPAPAEAGVSSPDFGGIALVAVGLGAVVVAWQLPLWLIRRRREH